MTTQIAMVKAPTGGALAKFTPEDRNIVTNIISQDAKPAEIDYFLRVCGQIKANPVLKEAHLLITKNKNGGARRVHVHVGINWLKRMALESGNMEAIYGPNWAAEDGIFQPCLPAGAGVYAAQVGIKLKTLTAPIWCVAYWDEFGAHNAKYWDNGAPSNNWAKMPRHMLGKVAMSHALRFALADIVQGVYTTEELEATALAGEEIPVEVTFEEDKPPAAPPAPRAAEHVTSPPPPVDGPPAEAPADDTEVRQGLIAAIKVLLPTAFPGDDKDGVDWSALKDRVKPMEWSEKYGRSYPMLKEWSVPGLVTLRDYLEEFEPEPVPEPEPEAQEAEVTPKAEPAAAPEPTSEGLGGSTSMASDFAPDPDA